MIAEVLSPQSVTIDLGDKPSEYMKLPGIQAYIVLSRDEAKAWVRVRDKGGFPSGPEVISGLDASIRIEALSIELPLAEIYADLPVPDEQA